MIQDLRVGWRLLRKQPGFTVLAVLTLALGIGTTAAVFSLVQGALLTPPPYPQPDRLMLVLSGRNDGQPTIAPRAWPPAQWMQWQAEAQSFEGIAAYTWNFNFLIDADGSESLEGMRVTKDYFKVLGIRPVLGRTFLDAETEPGAAASPVIIIGHELWERKFNGDQHIVGKSIRISRQQVPRTIVGVMPPGARFLPSPGVAQEPNYDVNAHVDFWIPANPAITAKTGNWDVVARLKDGVAHERGQAELAAIVARQTQTEPQFQGFAPRVQPLVEAMNQEGGQILLPLFGAAALVLLIACGNVAALLLVRGLQRQQEFALRTALGVSRIALVRQVCAESLLLALVGGVLGSGLAFGLVMIFKTVAAHAIPRLDAVTPSWPLLGYGLGVAVIAAVAAGMLPALRASRLDPIKVLKSSGPSTSTGRGERRLLGMVTMFQTALTLALLVGAGLLIRTMGNVARVHAGYDVERVLTMTVTAVEGDWSQFHRRALDEVAAVPGIQRVAFAWGVPLTGNNWPGMIEIEGQPIAVRPSDRVPVPLRSVTPGYFALLGQTIIEGRDFRSTDVREAPMVAVVNQTLADRYFPNGSALGKKMWLNGRERPPSEVVGVVADSRTDDITRSATPEIYLSLWQQSAFSKDLIVRTAGDPAALAPVVQRVLRSIDPTAAVENVRTLAQVRSDSLAARTFAMELLVAFAIGATLLTAIGLYGVLSLTVAARRREFAIRTAIGAERRNIRRLVLINTCWLVGGGIIAGLGATALLSRALQAFLYDVGQADSAAIAGAGLLFVGVALLACWQPMRQAAAVDPLEALRYE